MCIVIDVTLSAESCSAVVTFTFTFTASQSAAIRATLVLTLQLLTPRHISDHHSQHRPEQPGHHRCTGHTRQSAPLVGHASSEDQLGLQLSEDVAGKESPAALHRNSSTRTVATRARLAVQLTSAVRRSPSSTAWSTSTPSLPPSHSRCTASDYVLPDQRHRHPRLYRQCQRCRNAHRPTSSARTVSSKCTSGAWLTWQAPWRPPACQSASTQSTLRPLPVRTGLCQSTSFH